MGNSLLHRFDLGQDISEILRKNRISISAYRKAVSDYKNAHSKEEKRDLEDYLRHIKGNLRTQISQNDPKVVSLNKLKGELDNLLAPQLFEISKKEQAQRSKQAKELQTKITKIQAEVDEIRDNKIFVGAFEWRIEFPEVLDEDGRFVGFDCVIGNPPYIQLQKMGADADALQKMNYETYERTGDIYCLFYEMGMKLLKPGALLSFITSNKWMRAGYGEPLRKYFSEKQDVISLIDFAGYKVFDSATVDVNILTAVTRTPFGCTNACSINKDEFDITKLSDYVQTHSQTIKFGADAWSILSDIELSIKNKIEAVGTPLKDWNVDIFRGVLTGYNDAFIISSEKREEILANCIDESERQRTAAIIRPILRGRDIKRYGYSWSGLWLINTHNGTREGLERIHIEDYPSVKEHLDNYWLSIEKRADKGDTPYNLRNCAYLDEFSKPKIVWAELSRTGNSFAYSEDGAMVLNTCYILSFNDNDRHERELNTLLGFLNSKIALFYLDIISSKLDETGWRWLKQFVEQIPVPVQMAFKEEGQFTNKDSASINAQLYQQLGLSPAEAEYLEGLI